MYIYWYNKKYLSVASKYFCLGKYLVKLIEQVFLSHGALLRALCRAAFSRNLLGLLNKNFGFINPPVTKKMCDRKDFQVAKKHIAHMYMKICHHENENLFTFYRRKERNCTKKSCKPRRNPGRA